MLAEKRKAEEKPKVISSGVRSTRAYPKKLDPGLVIGPEERQPRKRRMPSNASKRPKATVKKIKPSPKVVVKKPLNWKLVPNPEVKVLEKDPLFDGAEAMPFISSTANSKLVIRAVLTGNDALLKECIANRKDIHTLNIKRSVDQDVTALEYIIKESDVARLKILGEAINRDKHGEEGLEPRVPAPENMLQCMSSSRFIATSRGAREGNLALTKESTDYFHFYPYQLARTAMESNVTVKFAREMVLQGFATDIDLRNNVIWAVINGHAELAAHFIQDDIRQNEIGSSFNHFHHEALTWDGEKLLDSGQSVRDASVRKSGPDGLTPLHCACLNPSSKALETLFAVTPCNLVDHNSKSLAHYAALAKTTECLKFLGTQVKRDGLKFCFRLNCDGFGYFTPRYQST